MIALTGGLILGFVAVGPALGEPTEIEDTGTPLDGTSARHLSVAGASIDWTWDVNNGFAEYPPAGLYPDVGVLSGSIACIERDGEDECVGSAFFHGPVGQGRCAGDGTGSGAAGVMTVPGWPTVCEFLSISIGGAVLCTVAVTMSGETPDGGYIKGMGTATGTGVCD